MGGWVVGPYLFAVREVHVIDVLKMLCRTLCKARGICPHHITNVPAINQLRCRRHWCLKVVSVWRSGFPFSLKIVLVTKQHGYDSSAASVLQCRMDLFVRNVARAAWHSIIEQKL